VRDGDHDGRHFQREAGRWRGTQDGKSVLDLRQQTASRSFFFRKAGTDLAPFNETWLDVLQSYGWKWGPCCGPTDKVGARKAIRDFQLDNHPLPNHDHCPQPHWLWGAPTRTGPLRGSWGSLLGEGAPPPRSLKARSRCYGSAEDAKFWMPDGKCASISTERPWPSGRATICEGRSGIPCAILSKEFPDLATNRRDA